MLYNTQNNPKWGSLTLGQSSSTMAQFGCTTTAYSNGVEQLPTQTLQIAKYTSNGSIIWESLIHPVWKFHNRVRQFNRARLREIGDNPNYLVLLEVINGNSPTGRHWVTLEKLGWLGRYYCIDPYNPTDKWNALQNFYTIFQVLGHAEFIKK